MDHGSYLLILPGMPVKGIDGTIGIVDEVVADAGVDVFRGIIVLHGLLATKRAFISEDVISGVSDTEVDVRISKADFGQLPVETS